MTVNIEKRLCCAGVVPNENNSCIPLCVRYNTLRMKILFVNNSVGLVSDD